MLIAAFSMDYIAFKYLYEIGKLQSSINLHNKNLQLVNFVNISCASGISSYILKYPEACSRQKGKWVRMECILPSSVFAAEVSQSKATVYNQLCGIRVTLV
jgi:hypothetical protein